MLALTVVVMRRANKTWNSKYSDPNITNAILSDICMFAISNVAQQTAVDSTLTLVVSCDVISGHDVTSGDLSVVTWVAAAPTMACQTQTAQSITIRPRMYLSCIPCMHQTHTEICYKLIATQNRTYYLYMHCVI